MNAQAGEWQGDRFPYPDPFYEAERKDAYWAWLDASSSGWVSQAQAVAEIPEGGFWGHLQGRDDADFEALHMRHSIGHSWDKYSQFGPIYSLRDADGIPQATVLVSDRVVVHAREHSNARLSAENEALLASFAASQGWTVKLDKLPFDAFADPGLPNTRITYLHRGSGGTKTFGQVVVGGRITNEDLTALAEALPGGREFHPDDVGLTDLRVGEGDPPHEIVSVICVADEPTLQLGIDDIVQRLVAASPSLAPATRK